MDLKKICVDSNITTSRSFYVFIHYILWIWICDVINMFALFTNHEQDTIFVNLLALIITGFIIKYDLKLFIFEKTDYKCFIAILLLGIIALIYALYPDNSHDTWAYHLLNQDPVWQGDRGFSYRENSYPLADRLFYLFRYILGFKLGTLFNCFLLSLTYVQVIRIFKEILGQKMKGINLYVVSLLCVSLETIFVIYATYMTDLTSAPLILEAVICLLSITKKNRVSYLEMAYFVICLGFIYLMKLTTVFYIIPLLVTYLVLAKKNLTYKKFIGCCILGILIVIPYLIYNFVITGMPFYPIDILSQLPSVANVNTQSTLDGRWGATNLWEIIFWPVIMVLKPRYRHMEMVRMPNIYPFLAVCCGIWMVIKGIVKKERDEKNLILMVISLVSLYLWILSRSVDRYAVCSIILCGVATICYLYTFSKNKILRVVVTALFVFQAGCSYYSLMSLGVNLKWPPRIDKIVENASHCFFDTHYGHDRGRLVSNKNEYKYYVSPKKYYNSYGKFLNEESILFDLYEMQNLPDERRSEVYEDMYRLQQEGNYFYTASMEGGLDGSIQDTVSGLKQNGFKVVDMEFMQNTYLGNIVVYKSLLSDSISDAITFSEKDTVKIGLEGEKILSIKGLVFVSPKITWTKDPTLVNFYTIDDVGNKVVVLQKRIIPGNAENIDIVMDASTSSDLNLYIECNNNYGLDYNFAYIVGLEQEEIANPLLNCVSFDENGEAGENPWGVAAGIIEVENDRCILLNPKTSANIMLPDNIEELSISYKIHPSVSSASDGAGITLYLYDNNNSILVQQELEVSNENDWEEYCLDLMQYNNPKALKLICNGGQSDINICDWVIIK